MFSYNTSVHEGTRYTLYELVVGRLARVPYLQYYIALVNKLNKTQEVARQNLVRSKVISKEYYDRRARPQNVKEGDEVFLLKERTSKSGSIHGTTSSFRNASE